MLKTVSDVNHFQLYENIRSDQSYYNQNQAKHFLRALGHNTIGLYTCDLSKCMVLLVIPAQAGIHPTSGTVRFEKWIPACAGMT